MTGFALSRGVVGAAKFSDDKVYRHWLSRIKLQPGKKFNPDKKLPFMLWVGCYPIGSATEHADDYATAREYTTTLDEGFDKYVKVNCVDLIASHHAQLLKLGEVHEFRSSENRKIIKEFLTDPLCEKVVVTFGNFPIEIRAFVRKTVNLLYEKHKEIYCYGMNKDGAPKAAMSATMGKPLVVWERRLY